MDSIEVAKKLTITFNEKTKRPEYHFEGRWVGADASLAERKLWKAYKNHLLDKRKDISLKKQQETEVNEAKAKETDNAKRTKPARAENTSTRWTRKTK